MIAAVRLVLPWSMWPIVPMLTCGLVRSNFFLAIVGCSLLLARSGSGLDLRLLDELRGQAGRDLGVVTELHRRRRPTLGHRPQVRDVAEHLGERDERPDDLASTPRDSIPSIWPRRLLRSPITSPMNSSGIVTSIRMIGSRIAGSALREGVLDGHRAGDLERHLRRVDLVVRAVEERGLDVDHREAGVDARLERLADAGVDRLDVLARDRAADDLVDELVARALLLAARA